jgi:hypothetical protein
LLRRIVQEAVEKVEGYYNANPGDVKRYESLDLILANWPRLRLNRAVLAVLNKLVDDMVSEFNRTGKFKHKAK